MERGFGTLCLVTMLAGCGARPEPASLKFRPADPASVNIFFLIGAPNGLAGVPTDIREMTKVLSEPSSGFNWRVRVNSEASKTEILEELRSYAAEVGQNGSLGLYFSGHGTKEGQFITDGGALLGFDEVADTIAGRRDTPLRRLLTFNDSCYSGHWVDGIGHLPDEKSADVSPEAFEKFANTTVEAMTNSFTSVHSKNGTHGIQQFFTMAAARKSQMAIDDGAENGGAFTFSLRTTFRELKRTPEYGSITVGKFAERTASATYERTRFHTPVYKAYPLSLLEEQLFEFAH